MVSLVVVCLMSGVMVDMDAVMLGGLCLIPACVSGFFIDIKSFRSHYGPGVDSASNRNEYQEHFMGVKAAGV